MLKGDEMICDGCQKVISHVTPLPADGWPRLHSLCSACFAALWQKSIPPA
jgi:hypothetical protein